MEGIRSVGEMKLRADSEMTIWTTSKSVSRRDSKKESKCLTVKTIWKNSNSTF